MAMEWGASSSKKNLQETISKIDQGICCWKQSTNIVAIAIYFADNIIWVGTKKFEDTI